MPIGLLDHNNRANGSHETEYTVTLKYPDLRNLYLHILVDNLIQLLRKSQHYNELKLKVWVQIKKIKGFFFVLLQV